MADGQFPSSEPIAIIGMSCRFSGEASSIDGFWEILRLGRKEHGRVPTNRYHASAWEHPSHERKGAINHDSGFFLAEDPARFDAPFFSITSKEAAGMDPVQRLLLEVAYEAFENGGVPMESLPGSATGVYSGCMTNDYELLSTRDIMDMPHNSATGNGRTMLANRLSWFFDLRGPSIMLDTACSSSLTALHLATQALRSGECSMAMVTGASLILHPNFTQRLSYMHMLSADGISHSFDARANGYGRGEGFGAVLLKPLSKALEDGNTIRAIVRATGSNQDGRTPGITMPNAEAQADLIRATYQRAQLSTRDTAYFEAHGTGTEIGDPAELSAVGATFGVERPSGHEPLYVGSVKSNVGHTEGAAGVASLIKVALCLEKEMLVPNAGFSHLNPRIRLNEWGLRLSDTTMRWPAHLLQRASINSFGFGGSNTHAILESVAQYLGAIQKPSIDVGQRIPQLVVISTHDRAGLNRTAGNWRTYLDSHCVTKQRRNMLPDLAYTMAKHRSQMGFRSFAVADSIGDLRDKMAAGLPSFPRASRNNMPNLAFIFTGQSAQWARMGMELLKNPAFAESFDRSQQALQGLGCSWNLRTELGAEAITSLIDQPGRSQPICCALQIALLDVLRSWKVSPKAVVGHSSGEVGAAYGAGYLSHEDAIRITYYRGLFSQRIAEDGPRGGMLAAGISAANAQAYLKTLPERSVVVACVNSPSSVTFSGDINQISSLEKRLQADGLFFRKLRVETAYHSPHMEGLVDDYWEAIKGIKPLNYYNDSVAMFSSVTKERIQSEDLDAAYWVRNLVSPVEFAEAVTKVITMTESKKGRRRETPVKWAAFLEIGPHEALKGPFNQNLQEANPNLASVPYIGLVLRKQDAQRTAMQAAGLLWSVGYPIDVDKTNRSLLDGKEPQMVQDLPSYAWNHQSSFWHEPLESFRLRRRVEARHDLLGVPLDYQNDREPRWRNFLRLSEQPWIADHVVAGSIIFPAAGMVAMVSEAARQLAEPKKWLEGVEFQDLEFFRSLMIPSDDRGIEVLLQVRPHPSVPGLHEFGIYSLTENTAWAQHSKGAFSLHYGVEHGVISAADWESTVRRVRKTQGTAREIEIETVYQWLSETGGVIFGPTFRSMVGASFDSNSPRVYVSGVVPDTKLTMPYERESPYFIHPTTLDALFQAAVISCSDSLSNQEANIPVAVDRLYLSTGFSLQPGDRFAVFAETHLENGISQSDSIASDPSWKQPGVVLQGVKLGRVPMRSNSSEQTTEVPQSRFSTPEWVEHPDSFSGPEALLCCPGGLRGWVEKVCYSCGDARVLMVVSSHCTETVISAVESFLPKSGRRPCLQHLTVIICHQNEEELSGQAQAVEQALPGSQILPVGSLRDVQSALPGSIKYHAVTVDHPLVWSDDNIIPLLENLPTISERSAWVAIRAPSANRDDALKRVLGNADWEVCGSIQEANYLLLRRRMSRAKLDPVVYILTAGRTDIAASLLNELGNVLGHLGAKMELINIHNAPDMSKKMVISLVELYRPWTVNWNENDMKRFQSLLKAKYLLWVSQCPHHEAYAYAASEATSGLLRVIRNENPNITLPQLLVDEQGKKNGRNLAYSITHVLQLTLVPLSRCRDSEFYVRRSRLLVPRVIAAKPLDDTMEALLHGQRPVFTELACDQRPLRLRNSSAQLDTAVWEPDDRLENVLNDDEVEVQLQMVTLSENTGAFALSPEARIEAVEAVGTVHQVGRSFTSAFAVGDGVLCVIPGATFSNGIATRMRVSGSSILRRPAEQDPAQSVSMPVAYSAAHASLFGSSGSSPSSALIVGRISHTLFASIDCAVATGLRVYIAVDDQEAVNKLGYSYPTLKEHIVLIHPSLVSTISRLTNRQGVDISVCCLGGIVSRLAGSCLAPGGRLVDLSGKMDLSALPQRLIDRGCTLSSLQMPHMLRNSPRQFQTHLHQAVELLSGNNSLGNLYTYPIFPVSQLVDAITYARDMSTRVIVDLQAAGKVPLLPTLPDPATLNADNTYLLVGGLGTIGLALAKTLAQCGARHLVFLNRSGATQKAQQAALIELQAQGVRTDVVCCNIARREDVEGLLAQAEEYHWCVRGVVQCATVLKDAMFDRMGFDAWKQSTESKIRGTLNLHEVLGNKDLDFFVTLSSISGVIGNMGQANYAAGNAFMDALMIWRRRHGLTGHSINIGLVPDASGVGDVAESPEKRRQRYRHVEGTEIELFDLQTLLRAIVLNQAPVPAQVIAGMTDILPRADNSPAWQFDRKFDHRIRVVAKKDEDAGAASKSGTLLRGAHSTDEAVGLVNQLLQEYLAGAMAAAPDSIDLELPLSALGVDSLKAVEVQNWVARELGAELSSFEFLRLQPAKALAEKITAASSFISPVE
ncbi:polyketide synthase [Aspergillus ambiguus]|uniref:polyketide synthase n=1 Tax=Aspergillus ambiguus TaxID=176160 RepID=UPI003CCCAC6E